MTKDTTMIKMTNIDNQHMNQIHMQVVITWDIVMTATVMTVTVMTATAMTATVMTATAMTWLHMINKDMIIVMIKAHTVTIVTTKPRIKNMNVEQVHLKDSLQVQ